MVVRQDRRSERIPARRLVFLCDVVLGDRRENGSARQRHCLARGTVERLFVERRSDRADGPALRRPELDRLHGTGCVLGGRVGRTKPADDGFSADLSCRSRGKGVVERWNGSSWSMVASPQSAEGTYLSGVACTGPSDCWIVGSLTNNAGSAGSALFEHWNGRAFTATSLSSLSGSPGDFLRQVDCVNASDCVAVGASGLQGGIAKGMEPAAAGWNGSSWSSVATTKPTAFASMLDSVSCGSLSECFAGGFDLDPSGQGVAFRALLERLDLPQGYSLTGSDGGAFSFGSARFAGSMSGRNLVRPVVAMATPDGDGYWLVGSDGGVFSFGDAQFGGSEAGRHLSAPIAAAATAGRGGYWLVGSDGGVFSLGGAGFHGSMAGRHLVAPVVAAAAYDVGGYWLAGSDGGVFSFGDAGFHGSMATWRLAAPIVAIAATPDGGGYWLVGSDGGVFSFGDAGFHGSMPTEHLTAHIVDIVAAPDGGGYWLVGSDGGVFSFGDADVPGLGVEPGTSQPRSWLRRESAGCRDQKFVVSQGRGLIPNIASARATLPGTRSSIRPDIARAANETPPR